MINLTLTRQALTFEIGCFNYLTYQTVSPKRCYGDGKKKNHSVDSS